MKLEKLNPEQKKLLKTNKEKFIKKFLNKDKINIPIAKEVIKFVYSLIKKDMPIIYLASNPLKAQQMANKLKGTEKKYYSFGTYLTIYWASWYAWVETYIELGIITAEKFPKYFELRKFIDSNIFMTIEFEKAIIIVEKPVICIKNENGLHNVSGKAIQWENGYGQYYINGRNMPKRIFETKFTKEDFFKEENEDVRGGMYEIIEAQGEGSMLTFLGAKEIDKKSFVHANGEIEEMILYKTDELFAEEEDLNGKSPAALAWLKMSCASTGQNYLIPSDSSFTNCVDAAKYHRPSEVPTEIEYKWNSRS